MCVVDRKTYLHSDGRRETVETTTRCPRAAGNGLCKHVYRRESQGAQYVEIRPSHDRSSSDGFVVTEGKNGRQQVYRDPSHRSSNSTSSVRRSNTMSDRSSISIPSSASSPSYSEPKTAGPSPPPLGNTTASPLERTRQPYSSMPMPPPPPPPEMIITPDGTAQYSRPPSLSMERASDNERPSTSAGERTLPRQNSSFSSMKAEVDDPEEVVPVKPRRKPSLKVKTEVRPSRSTSSPSIESPGLSSLPSSISHFRKDSAKEVPRPESSKGKQARFRADSDREKRKEKDSRRRDEKPRRRGTDDDRLRRDAEDRRRKDEDRKLREQEEERQARLERGRLAQSDARQSAREMQREADALRERLRSRPEPDAASDASCERHRQATLSALEREPDGDGDDDDDDDEYASIRPYLDAEQAQMERERAAAARRRESANNPPAYVDDRFRREPADDFPSGYINDQLRRDAEARAQYESRRPERRSSKRSSDRPAPRGRAYTYNTTTTSPVATRSPISARAQPVVHQYPSARHSGTIPARGADVIAQAQARGSRGSGNMNVNDAFANLTMSGGLGDEMESSGRRYYYDEQGRKRFLS